MIFEQDSVAFQILDVLYLNQGQCKIYNSKRSYQALSLRYKADTVIEYRDKQLAFSDNSIGFFPSDTDYVRTTRQDVLIAVHIKSYDYQAGEIEQFFPENPGKYQVLFKELLDCWDQKKTGYKHDAAATLNRIFAELYRDNQKACRSESKIEASVQYMKDNCLKKDFSLEEAAKKSFISSTYFRKLFKAEYGVSPKKYVIDCRMKHAASLIISGYYTLSEIAGLCGYNDYKHFLVEFKKVMGVSPSGYTGKIQDCSVPGNVVY